MKKLVATLSLLFSFTLLYSSTTYAITSGGGRASTSTSTSTSSSVSSSSASRSASTSSSMSASRSSSSVSSNASRSSNTRSTNSSMNRSTSSLPPSNRNYSSSSSRNNYNSTSSFLPTQNMLMWFLIFNSIQSEEQQRNILQEKAKKQKGNMYVLHVKTKDGMKLLPVSKNDYNKVKEGSKVEFKNNQLNIK